MTTPTRALSAAELSVWSGISLKLLSTGDASTPSAWLDWKVSVMGRVRLIHGESGRSLGLDHPSSFFARISTLTYCRTSRIASNLLALGISVDREAMSLFALSFHAWHFHQERLLRTNMLVATYGIP